MGFHFVSFGRSNLILFYTTYYGFLNTSTGVKNFAMRNSRGRALRSEGWNRGDHRRLEYKLRVLCISMGNSSVSGHSSVPRDVRVHRRGGPGPPGAMTQDISRQALRFLCTPRQKKKKKKRPELIHTSTHYSKLRQGSQCEWKGITPFCFVSFDGNNLRSWWTKVVVFEVLYQYQGWINMAGYVRLDSGLHTPSAKATHKTHSLPKICDR